MRTLQDLMSLTQASQLLGKTTETLRKYADTGRVRCVRDPSGRRLLVRADVERLATQQAGSAKRLHG
jgi:predicted site-specific integrase-resolvase